VLLHFPGGNQFGKKKGGKVPSIWQRPGGGGVFRKRLLGRLDETGGDVLLTEEESTIQREERRSMEKSEALKKGWAST